MKAVLSTFDADRWSYPPFNTKADLPAEAPLAMPVQSFETGFGTFSVPASSPRNIGARRMALFSASIALTCFSLAELVRVSAPAGVNLIEAVLLLLFMPLFAWIALSFCSALAGFIALVTGKTDAVLLRDDPRMPVSRTAVLMPIYNEDVDAVFRRLRAMIASLKAEGATKAFEIFVLSDSTDAEVHQAERLAFEMLRQDSPVDVYYRRRPLNTERKPGNIAEWVRRFGGAYDHMIVLDADSLMSGNAMVKLADAMERNPGVGLIQTVPIVANCTSLFGRWQQFAARLYGPVSTAGLIWWSGSEGSFWGHNAIVRVKAFAESCGLPALRGPAPFGGHIMSHDLVEAALLRRQGWAVHMVSLPEGSYEEYPPTPIDYAIRDRRWCQGNLQHLQLLGSAGMHWISRLHLLMGASAYLTSPLWALLIGASLVQVGIAPSDAGVGAAVGALSGWLLLLTTGLLLGPKLLSLLWTLIDEKRRAEFGGGLRLLSGVMVDVPLAALFAPAVMVTQIGALIGLLLGRKSGWASQRRDVSAIMLDEAFRGYRPHLLVGCGLLAMCVFAPSLTLWLMPVVIGLLFSPLLVMASSRRDLGLWAKDMGLLLTPEELRPTYLLVDGQTTRESAARPDFARLGRMLGFEASARRDAAELVKLR